jgi:cell division protein FtsB
MNVDLGIWEKLRRLVVFLLFVAGLMAVIVWYLPLIRHNERVRQEIMRKTVHLRQEEDHSRQLESAIRALRTDPRALERLAREKLGYIKPGETRIQFEPPTPRK